MIKFWNDANNIHPTSIIEGDVKIGKNNVIHPYCVIIGPVDIGDNNIIGPHTIIGSPGADTRTPRYDTSNKRIIIGNNNIIREFTAIQKPCYEDLTILGNDIYIMQGVHVAHDLQIANKVVITASVALGGLVRLMEGANLALGCSVNQYTVIGHYSIVASGAFIAKNLRPFSKFIPGKPLSVNDYALNKYGLNDYREEIVEYVINGKRPVSTKIESIVEEYERNCNEHKRK